MSLACLGSLERRRKVSAVVRRIATWHFLIGGPAFIAGLSTSFGLNCIAHGGL